MQAFLLFSSSPFAENCNEGIASFCKDEGLTEHHILSKSDNLGRARLVEITKSYDSEALRTQFAPHKIDVNILSKAPSKKKILLSDMDSTIITTESLDELSEFAGKGDVIKAITKRAMAGELDFMEALNERLSILAGEPSSVLQKVVEATDIFDGADHLVRTMRHHGADCYLVSGGFTFLSSVIAGKLHFTDHMANNMDIEDEKIKGSLSGTVIDSSAKLRILTEKINERALGFDDAMTIGDGANDIPMLTKAGLGIAWRAKEIVKKSVPYQLNHSSHCGGLFLQGYSEAEIQ